MSLLDEFLPTFKKRPWAKPTLPDSLKAGGIVVPHLASAGFEIALTTADERPAAIDVKNAWRDRQARSADHLLLVTLYSSPEGPRASVVGTGDDRRNDNLPVSVVEQVVTQALDATNRLQFKVTVDPLFAYTEDLTPGLNNQGLFADHALHSYGKRNNKLWSDANAKAAAARGQRGVDALQKLGWTPVSSGTGNYVLTDGEAHRAIAVALEQDETYDSPSLRFGLGISPVEQAIEAARERGLTWVIALKGSKFRLYSADVKVGIQRRGSSNFTEIDLALLPDDEVAYAWLLLSPDALRPGGTAFNILDDSKDHATSLGARLRERIYNDVVPELAEVIANRIGDSTEQGLQRAYHETLVILFRLLFVAYAEDRGLLPYSATSDTGYTRHSLKRKARHFAEDPHLRGGDVTATELRERFDSRSTDIWDDLLAIWHGIYNSHSEWGIPAYGGSLFDDTTAVGNSINSLGLANAEIGPALVRMLVDNGRDGTYGPVDFRALSVREFGTIYEGLLESSLSVAPTDLTLDKTKVYVPAKAKDEVTVQSGQIYFHNASGARKATGSYFTKEFAVEHLLETALDPTLDEHLERVADLVQDERPADAAEALFDFHVADIAMGSGHFLVAAVDHIAAKMNDFLADHPIAQVNALLDSLATSAKERLHAVGVTEDPVILRNDLIRRQVAKRCIYGVDINEIAVDLARLAIWIHTFVPGLPMSSLEHGLVHGNSLTGIGTIDEAMDALEPESKKSRGGRGASFFYDEVIDALNAGSEPLARAAAIAEASIEESREALALYEESRELVEPIQMAFDAIVADRLGLVDLRVLTAVGWDAVVAAGRDPQVVAAVEKLNVLHFPVAFPEVFRPGRTRPGFDVVLGNPPWDEVMVEEPKFWQRYTPGIMGLKPDAQKQQIKQLRKERADLLPLLEAEQADMAWIRSVLLAGPFPGLGEGDVDYYKAFAWRDWTLMRDHGRMGTVFPRSLLNAAGSAQWRNETLLTGEFELVVTLANTGKWVFDDVDGRYSVALLTLAKRAPKSQVVPLVGPFHSLSAFEAGKGTPGQLNVSLLTDWGNGAAFPLLPTTQSATIFAKFRQHPRFDSTDDWSVRVVREFDATNDRKTFDAGGHAPGRWPVLTGASFNHWDPDFGDPYAWADSDTVTAALFEKRKRQARNKRTAFYALDSAIVQDPSTLPCLFPRIAFRDVARSTDSRTMISCLVPPGVVLTNKAPYLYFHEQDPDLDAYILGVLSSVPFDWYSRRFVELAMSIGILNAMPVPRPGNGSPLRKRVIEISGRLAAVDERFSDWAVEVGVPVGSVRSETEKQDLIAELDALVSLLYGLDRDDIEHVFATFHRGWDYAARLASVLDHFDHWSDKASHNPSNTTNQSGAAL